MTIDPQTLPAYGFAACSHLRQKRKYTGEPYVTHCLAVARTVATFTEDADVVSAALLHDVIEDTGITAEELASVFGERITRLVLEVTDASRKEDGNRAVRKRIDREHLAKSSPEGATIKLADMLDNTSSVLQYDREFAKVYLPEKRSVLEVLLHGNGELLKRATATIDEAFRLLATPR